MVSRGVVLLSSNPETFVGYVSRHFLHGGVAMTLSVVGLRYRERIPFHDALDTFEELFQTPHERMG